MRLPYFLCDMINEYRYKRAVKRAGKCRHDRTIDVDYGIIVAKCRECWAIKSPEGEWYPNMVKPPSEIKCVTSHTRKNRHER